MPSVEARPANWEPRTMKSPNPAEERRRSKRRHLYHFAKIQFDADVPPGECLILDISEEGARLYVVGFDVPDEFVLVLSGDDAVQERCKVIWRRDRDIGAKFVGREPVIRHAKFERRLTFRVI